MAPIVALFLAGAAAAQVAQFVSIEGRVTVRHGEDGPWIPATANVPLAPGDYVATAPGARARINLDAATQFEAEAGTELRFLPAPDGGARLQLAGGTLFFHIFASSDTTAEVDTPSVTARPVQIGDYRILVDKRGQSEIMAVAGDLEVLAPQGSEWIRAGQKMLARGPASNPEFRIRSALSWWRRWGSAIANMIQSAGASSGASAGSDSGSDSTPAETSRPASSAASATTANASGSTHTSQPSNDHAGRGR